MNFNSLIFLFVFLPVALALYHLAPGRIKNLLFLFLSIFFYIWLDKLAIAVLLLSTIMNYAFAILISIGKKRSGLVAAVVLNILILVFFRYYDTASATIADLIGLWGLKINFFNVIAGTATPVGISFMTFKNISYIVDVYQSKVPASRNFTGFATYVMMCPTIVAGPIVRYTEIQDQFRKRRISMGNFASGIERFIIGLAKKVILGNSFASVADQIFSTSIPELSTSMAWIGMFTFTFQIYFDFSGYSDMAIGLGKMFGFDFSENFNYPYIAKNVREFWQRWHMTLSRWLRDYLFLPVAFSLSRRLKNESYFRVRTDHLIYMTAIFVTFLICGAWHGITWNFILWGAWYAFFIVFEHAWFGRKLKRMWIPVQHLYTLLIVMLGWVLFRTDGIGHAFDYFQRLFYFSPGDPARTSYLLFFHITTENGFLLMLSLLISAPLYMFVKKMAVELVGSQVRYIVAFKTSYVIFITVIFILSVTYLTAGSFNPFLYAQF